MIDLRIKEEVMKVKIEDLKKLKKNLYWVVKINNFQEYNRLKRIFPFMCVFSEIYDHYIVDLSNFGYGNKEDYPKKKV